MGEDAGGELDGAAHGRFGVSGSRGGWMERQRWGAGGRGRLEGVFFVAAG